MRKFILFLLILLTAVNLYLYINRDLFSYTKQSAFFELYPVYKDITIHSFKTISDSVLEIKTLEGKKGVSEWTIKNTSDGKLTKHIGNNPLFSLVAGTNTYIIKSAKFKDSLSVKVEFVPSSELKKNGADQGNRITVFSSDLPALKKAALIKWQQNIIPATAEERATIKTILRDSIKISGTDKSLLKAQKISMYLCSRIAASKGILADSVLNLSVCNQYFAALAMQQIDCGVYANIFSLFATEAGVTNRIVEIKHSYGTFDGNIHLFNEYFVEELGQWTATDIMLNNINYFDANNKLLNGVEIKNWSSYDSTAYVTHSGNNKDSVTASAFSDLTDEFFNYYRRDKDLYYYYSNDPSKIYTFQQKIKRYFTKANWYEVYSDVRIANNKSFYLKQFLLIAWGIFLFLGVMSLLLKRWMKI